MNSAMDTVCCVHERDIDGALDLALTAYHHHFVPRGQLHLVTNAPNRLRHWLRDRPIPIDAEVWADDELLTHRELALPGWFRQQVIKLRAAAITSTETISILGADTILLQPITAADLLAGAEPALLYRQHRSFSLHLIHEIKRVHAAGRLLGVRPIRAIRYIDFIHDLFCFSRARLDALNACLHDRYGPEPYATILGGLGPAEVYGWRFGEWTLYSTFVLDFQHAPVVPRDSARGLLTQIHSARDLRNYRYDSKVVHLVGKAVDLAAFQCELIRRGTPLGQHLGQVATAA